jgi:methionine biosynthesis protein MetW
VGAEDSLLDLGCGDGELLARLSAKKGCWVQGVEWEEDDANRCIERGIPVCHADLEKILPSIPDRSYTWAVLENTLFTLKRPLDVVREMLRIADRSVVTFPNFAHWSVRFTFSLGGRMPVTKALPYKWYDTPNIHLCSITDFLDVVAEWNLEILHSWVLVEGETVPFDPDTEQNITGEQALFVIRNRG